MNRGFTYYFREGVRSSAKALYQNRGLLRFFVYFFMSLLGRAFLVFNPMFDLSDMRQGRIVRKNCRVDISQSFKCAGDPHTLWTYVLTVCVEALIFLAGILLIGVFTAVLALIGYGISTLSDNLESTLFLGIFSAPGALLLLVYCVIMPLIFAPTPYIVSANRGIGVGDTLSVCFNTMKSCGKWTLFLNFFIPSLIQALIAGILVGCGYFISEALNGSQLYVFIMILWLIVAVCGFALTAPIFTLARRSANHHLFTDIVPVPANASKSTTGINVRKCNGRKFRSEEVEEQMTSIFQEPEDDPYEMPSGKKSTKRKETVNLADAVEPLRKKPVSVAESGVSVPEETESAVETAEEPVPSAEEEKPVTEQAQEETRAEDEWEEEPFELETVSNILSDGDKLGYDEEGE